jgi:flagellar hook assembly protein FlgD
VKPNPLNPKADISFTLTQPGRVTVAIYDLRGRLVRRVLDENRAVGTQTVAWNGGDASERRVASGTYYVRIQAPQGQEVRAVTVVK